MKIILTYIALVLSLNTFSQIITLVPSNADPDAEVTLIFDASQGNKELVGASKVYMHSGLTTDKPDGTSWKYVKGNWGKDDGVGAMQKVAGSTNKWEIKLSPTLRQYYGAPTNENLYRIACVFRNADGSKKGTITPGEYGWGTVNNGLDYFVNLKVNNYLFFAEPQASEVFLHIGDKLNIRVEASSNVTKLDLSLDEDSGYQMVQQITSGKTLNYEYTASKNVLLKLSADGIVNGESITITKTINIGIIASSPIQDLPSNVKQGVNYIDDSTATFVLLAPQKSFTYLVGDFTNWQTQNEYIMNKTPDGKYFWLTLHNLNPGKDYVYQYWVDGNIRIPDPYTTQAADPWNDIFIESNVFPNLPVYNKTNYGIASVLNTKQPIYAWSANESNWAKPDVNHLVIYELLIRDFIGGHSYKELIDTIQYLKRLGIQAIELMPVNEFEGNDSWGYNPSLHFALDKYYGTKNDLKAFIDIAHQNGIAVIMDIVLNHAYGQNPLVQLYFEGGKPATNNPWFNREYVGQYQWGYDFNHESTYTQQYVDDVNKYWLDEFHFDGFRFDFTKGFTNYAPGGSVDGFDQSRINILKRMHNKIKEHHPAAYVILEHWAPANEEQQLADAGMKMWRNKTYDYVPATIGNTTNNNFSGADATSHICFLDSHDERRIAEHCLTEGLSLSTYSVKKKEVMLERVKMAAAFMLLMPGPKMIWQFDELGYDIDINFNGRIGRKPLPWGTHGLNYYNDELRQYVYSTYQEILHLRNLVTPQAMANATKNHALTGDVRRLVYNTNDVDIVIIGNFALSQKSIDPKFTQIGKWYNYFEGDSITVTTLTNNFNLKAGEWRIYTNKKLSNGNPDLVETNENPVTISPFSFKEGDVITITFDARKASKNGTNGLVGANKVYMHSGVILDTATDEKTLTHTIGSFQDDGIGEMTKLGNEIWQIKITPASYYQLIQDEHIYKIGMWFRDESNTNVGYGFRDQILYFDVTPDLGNIVEIAPRYFTANDEVTITFNARIGNRELIGADKVYMHSGVGITNTSNPQSTAWNKVVGNWGQDDGIGEMQAVPGQVDQWQITFKPRQYYNMTNGEHPYWIAAVFRNANGSVKGTTAPGQYDNVLVTQSLDFFIKNENTVYTNEINEDTNSFYPNPTTGIIHIGDQMPITIYDAMGNIKWSGYSQNGIVDITAFNAGLYFIQYQYRVNSKIKKIIKIN